MSAPESPSAGARSRLGITGIADSVGVLAPGQVYALAVDAQPLRVPLVAQALRATLVEGGRCAVVLPGDPGAFVSKVKLLGIDLGWYEKSGELELVRQRHDPLLPLFRTGPAAVLELIARAAGEDRSLLVLEQAETLLFLGDPAHAGEACDGLRAWARRTGTTVIATFTPATRPQREFLSLRATAEDFAGFAVVREHEGGALLDLRHWFGNGGSNLRASVPLRTTATGELTAEPAQGAPVRVRDAGAPHVVAIETAIDDPVAAVRDSSWTLLKHHAELIEASRRLTAGAVVLAFDPATPLRALCQTVAAVRRVAAPWVSVLIRERGMRLRLAQQIALTRLGASTVVPATADDADLAQAIRALSGTACLRALPDDIERTIAAAGTATSPHLMVTRAFRDTVAEVLAASDGLELPHALLHVACDPAKAQQLGTFALQRKLRDAALTVDPTGLWVFLYGCPANRTARVAERAFGRYHVEIASGISVEGTVGAIARRLERLAAAVGVRDADPATRTMLPEPASTAAMSTRQA
ncbi:MAG: BcsE family c-di-GMP-binding protein [Burkholderiaceae bacterium]|nr:BcsE family c-di-GMP-binding protein [Burkholderiaceae bacterium]